MIKQLFTAVSAGLLSATLLPAQQKAETPPVTDPRPLSFHKLQWDYGTDTSWQRWWALEREHYLDLRSLARRAEASTNDGLVGAVWASQIEDADAPTKAQKQLLIRPGMIELLGSSKDLDVQSETLISLGRLGVAGDETVYLLRDYLRVPSRGLAHSAILGMGLLQHDSAWPVLRSVLKDDSNGRWLTGSEGSIDDDLRAWAAIAAGLGAEGWSARSASELHADLLDLVVADNADVNLRSCAASALGLIPIDPENEGLQVEPLFGLLHDDRLPQQVRSALPGALAQSVQHLPPLAERARTEILRIVQSSETASIRQSGIRALGLLPSQRAEEAEAIQHLLTRICKQGATQAERHFAALSLAQCALAQEDVQHVKDVAEVLVQQLQDSAPEQRAWAAIALGTLGFQHSDWMGASRVKAERALLSQLVNAKNDDERSASAISLGLCGQANAAPTLLRICEQDDHPTLRGHAAVALGLLGHNEAEPILLKQLAAVAHDPTVLEHTTIGLALLNSEEVHGVLLRMLHPESGGLPTLAEVTAAARGIALIGDARTAPFLLTAMDDSGLSAKSRALASRALGYIADHDGQPWQLRLTPGLNYLHAAPSVLDWESGNGVLDRR